MTGVNDTLEIKQMMIIFSEVQIYNKILNLGPLYIVKPVRLPSTAHCCHPSPREQPARTSPRQSRPGDPSCAPAFHI